MLLVKSASLLEAVVVEHLEAVDVEDADHGGLEVRLVLHQRRIDGGVHVTHDPMVWMVACIILSNHSECSMMFDPFKSFSLVPLIGVNLLSSVTYLHTT